MLTGILGSSRISLMLNPTAADVLNMIAVTSALESIEKPATILAKLHEMQWRCPSRDPEMVVALASLCATAAVMMEIMSEYGAKLIKEGR
jgi:hypothetical protein